MNTLRTNISAVTSYNSWRIHSQQSVDSMKQISTGKKLSVGSLNSSTYIQGSNATNSLRSLVIGTRNINSAIALIGSIDSTASNIQKSLIDMRTVAMTESDLLLDNHAGDKGRICDYFQQAEEAIIDMANSHSWNGQNFMIGGGENNETTTLLNFFVNAGGSDASDTLQMTFKSFHPHSAIDTTRGAGWSFWGNPAAPNLPDLNRTAGTDTHAYGDAAMYHANLAGQPYTEGHLHGDNQLGIDHTIMQLDRAIDGVTNERARLGAYLSRLNQMNDNIMSETLNARRTNSEKWDANYASTVSAFSRSEILKNSSMAILAQANRRNSGLLQLLQ